MHHIYLRYRAFLVYLLLNCFIGLIVGVLNVVTFRILYGLMWSHLLRAFNNSDTIRSQLPICIDNVFAVVLVCVCHVRVTCVCWRSRDRISLRLQSPRIQFTRPRVRPVLPAAAAAAAVAAATKTKFSTVINLSFRISVFCS